MHQCETLIDRTASQTNEQLLDLLKTGCVKTKLLSKPNSFALYKNDPLLKTSLERRQTTSNHCVNSTETEYHFTLATFRKHERSLRLPKPFNYVLIALA